MKKKKSEKSKKQRTLKSGTVEAGEICRRSKVKSYRNKNGMMAEAQQKRQMLGVGRERKTRVKEKKSF